MGLAGEVSNHTGGVSILVQGPEAEVEAFVRDLAAQACVPSRLHERHRRPAEDRSFAIVPSERTAQGDPCLSDIAVCADCLAEMLTHSTDATHPFINCTNCGPRFTIVNWSSTPRTSMSPFPCALDARRSMRTSRTAASMPTRACVECGPRLLSSDRVMTVWDVAELDGGRIVAIRASAASTWHVTPTQPQRSLASGGEGTRTQTPAVMFASLPRPPLRGCGSSVARRLIVLPRRGNGLAPG